MSFNRGTQSDGDIVDKIKSVNWRGLVRQATNKVKQYAMNLSPLEIQVEEATNLDTWGPHGSVMSDISDACFDAEGYKQVLGVIARRLQEKDERWRMCYKALLLLEYLIKHGPTKVAQDVASSSSVLNRLQHFEYLDANGKDHGVNIRHRATEICDLVGDPQRLREERAKAAENKAKYTGVSASQMRSGSVGFGSKSMNATSGGAFDRSSLSRPGGDCAPGQAVFGVTSGSLSSTSHGPGFGGPHDRVDPVSSESVISPVTATQARIASMKLSERSTLHVDGEDTKPSSTKKRLSDVKANPKIAASLGLKVASPSKSSDIERSVMRPERKEASPVDLLGELEDPAREPKDVLQEQDTAWNPFGDDEKDPFNTMKGNESRAQAKLMDPFAISPHVTQMDSQSVEAPQPSMSEAEKKDPFADLLL